MNSDGACIVQRDFTVLLEKNHPGFEDARARLALFAELVKSPAYYHTYRITPLSLWNAAAAGMTAEEIARELSGMSRWEVPGGVIEDIIMWVSRYGSLKLCPDGDDPGRLCLESTPDEPELLPHLVKEKGLSGFGLELVAPCRAVFPALWRGDLKQALARLGYPVLDEAGYHQGQALSFRLKDETGSGRRFALRPYQQESVEAFAGGSGSGASGGDGGSGVLVLPCGAGKTVIGLAAMSRFQCETLILTSSVTSVRQWISEIADKTTLPADAVGEYTGETKQVRPVTVSTYQILTHRGKNEEKFKHMSLFKERDWGLIIYDEVHLLPAPVFRATADIQATRRLGLTATLVREDGCERDVFSLIGPKRYEVPWKALEESGFIAQVECREVRVGLPETLKERYLLAEGRDKYRIAAENPRKNEIVKRLVTLHAGRQILIIGQYLDQLRGLAADLGIPLITGSMPQAEREQWFAKFRSGAVPVLAVSKVANFAVDLPDASVAIQISGSFGSRQEEAQRLGRILRPKRDGGGALFYTLVSEETREQEFAMRRQLFLIEQGYEYEVSFERGEGA
ncbi:DNA repair helicase XPB [Paenibacillus sp. M1]|uniref:DNA 3'-5' helicase n=1 Tax=Paenibacillus haidiansis TaxID=1574488 RepID=A0ABU7VLB7_9BACL